MWGRVRLREAAWSRHTPVIPCGPSSSCFTNRWFGRARSHRHERRIEAGFAAVDALVALTILATAIGFSMGAVSIARRSAGAAEEAHAARTQLQYLIETASKDTNVRTGGFVGRVSLAELPGDTSGPRLCRRTASLHSVRSGRDYGLSVLGFCPAEASS
jgi:hypothetical protein